jgi:hypothetical protein
VSTFLRNLRKRLHICANEDWAQRRLDGRALKARVKAEHEKNRANVPGVGRIDPDRRH